MSVLLARVREALSPRYEVEGEVASGGMATVFRARDTVLHRSVAVKVLRPEMATATGEGRFLREARTLASISHPNVVAIHDVDQRDGLSFYVMDLIEGETLQERFESGPLEKAAAQQLGQELLGALGRLHESGIVHRDVKPSNVFVADGRALLADFGIVQLQGSGDDTLTAEGQGPGTPAYMSPEQARGEPVSARSDLYSAGMVLYEALSGKRWPTGQAPEAGDWSAIPAAARPALRKALAIDPEHRWKDAEGFRSALRVKGPAIRIPRRAALVSLVVLAAVAWWFGSRSDSRGGTAGSSLLAVFPCTATRAADESLGADLARLIALTLDNVPEIHTVDPDAAFRLYERRGGEPLPSDWETLGASRALRCRLDVREDGLRVSFGVLDGAGNEVYEVYGRSLTVATFPENERHVQAAVDVTVDLLGQLDPDLTLTPEQAYRFAGHPWEAVGPFIQGEKALMRGAWNTADAHFVEALAQDSTLTLARWRLAEVHRWQADRPIDEDLSAILERDLSTLTPLDSLLLEAGSKPHGREQLAAYESILEIPEYSRNPYATLLYADELYHRGPLWGVAIDSAINLFRRAVELNPSLVPAVEHLTQALIRTDRREEAYALLERLTQIHASPAETDVYYPAIWGQGFREKFDPAQAVEGRSQLAQGPLPLFAMFSRFVRYIDAPAAQAEYGALLTDAADREGAARYAAQGFVDRGLGLIGQGDPARISEGIAAFDSAARRYETPRTLMQAAEWAVIPYALGVGGFGAVAAAADETFLEARWADPEADPCLRVRAALALALLADQRGDQSGRFAWAARLDSMAAEPGGSGADRPSRLAEALLEASRGGWREALNLTAADLAYDSVGLAERPFLRSALHLKRGEWYGELGMPDSARAAWVWYQNTDIEGEAGVAPELVQAGEVDGALGPHAEALIDALEEAEEP